MKKVGRYVVISELGRGAMGIVYKASDPTIDREVALKVLSLSVTQEEGTNSPQEMFMREVRAAGRLAHPSIVTIYDAFDDPENQTSCIVMELVPGLTLEKALQSGQPLTTDRLLSIIRQVAEALDYAHRNQVIHRDLKPANILVTEDGRAKITDFGIAKVLAREGVARTVGIMGTPSYMSPEQVRGGEIDARTDIFSLGIIIFTMLVGQKPFAGNTAAVMFKIVYEETPVPSTLNPWLTPAYDYVIKKCLAKDRNLRYASARELLGDLDDLEHDRSPRSQMPIPPPVPIPSQSIGAAPPPDETLAMPYPAHIKPAPKQPLPPSSPPADVAARPPGPSVPAPSEPAPEPNPLSILAARSLGQPASPSNALPVTGKTLVMRVPDLSDVSSTASAPPPAKPAPLNTPDFSQMERTEKAVPGAGPNLSTHSLQSSPSPRAGPAPADQSDWPGLERTVPMPAPDLAAASRAARPESEILPPPLEPGASREPEGTPGASSAPRPKLNAVFVGGVALLLLAAAAVGYRRFHHAKAAPLTSPQVLVEPLPLSPPPVPPDVVNPLPGAATEQPALPVSPTPEAANKPVLRKPKQTVLTQPAAPSPQPSPSQLQPVVAPAPTPATPTPEDIARAEAAKLATTPRVVQVVCNYGFKEATFTFSSGGKTLYEDTPKGKKKKTGFLGMKGSYEGSFSHNITVPAGASEVDLHVVSGDGSTDLNKAIKMLPPGGFVPTLAVDVDNDHLSLRWKGSSAEK